MSQTEKRERRSVTLAFLTVCIFLILIVVVHESWKHGQLKKFTRSLPEVAVPGLLKKVMFQEGFNDTSIADWREELRSGSTDYSVVYKNGGNSVLRARSDKAASVLIKKIQYDPRRYPYLKWKWRVDERISEADMTTLHGSDAPARVYVAFSHGIGIWNTRLINYVWASSMPKDSVIRSFLSPNSQIIVLQSGEENLGNWVDEERNIAEDYRNLYGEEPPLVEAIAIMTDADNTRSEAVAFYDDIRIKSQP